MFDLDVGRSAPRSHRSRRMAAPLTAKSLILHPLNEVPTLFRGRGCEKVAPAGQFEAAGRVAVPCWDDGSTELSLSGSAQPQLRLRGSHRPERLFADGAQSWRVPRVVAGADRV